LHWGTKTTTKGAFYEHFITAILSANMADDMATTAGANCSGSCAAGRPRLQKDSNQHQSTAEKGFGF
jgi:hypothetical protein